MELRQSKPRQEINCLLHWYKSWSNQQKQEFHDNLFAKALPNKVDPLADILGGMNMSDRPPNIFQCQIRLFNEWFEMWKTEERNFMIERLESIDPAFVEQFYERVRQSAHVS